MDEMSSPTFKQALLSAAELLLKFTVPLYEIDGVKPSLLGTGFLVRYSGKNFLISAAHVLEGIKERPLRYYIAPNITRKLTGKLAITSCNGPRAEDPIDIGVLLLDGDGQPPHPTVGKFAADFSYLRPTLLPRFQKQYLFIGYPGSRSKANPTAKEVTVEPYSYWCPSAPELSYSTTGYSATDHLLLPLDVKQGYDLDGVKCAFPKPHGMSGSPIVMLYDEVGENDPRIFPIVGVATTYLKEKNLVIATDIRIAVDLIMNTREFWN